MSREAGKLWTIWRQLPGNLLPILFCGPFLLLALRELGDRDPSLVFLAYTFAFIASGWLSVNFIGLTGNRKLRQMMKLRLKSLYPEATGDLVFVGFARPRHKGLLDPHQDIGFLHVGVNELTFFGAEQKFTLERALITQVTSKPNIHSLLMVGGWICLSAQKGERSYQLLLEPRERKTLWGNNRLRKSMIRELQGWLTDPTKASEIT